MSHAKTLRAVRISLWLASAYWALTLVCPPLRPAWVGEGVLPPHYEPGEEFITYPSGMQPLNNGEICMIRPAEVTYWANDCERLQMERIRLWGVEAKSLVTGCCLQDRIKAVAGSSKCRVLVRRHADPVDGYTVVVGEVVLSDGCNLGEYLIRSGLARWNRAEAPNAEHLRRAEQRAQADEAEQRKRWAEALRH